MRRSNPSLSSKTHADNNEEFRGRSRVFPLEIPDSQPGSPVSDFDDAEEPNDSASFKTVSTVVITGGTQLTPKSKPRWPLHNKGVNCNGRLPREAPQYSKDMDEEPTQQATQPYLDPRRQGIQSFSEDESDVICILLPTSRPAHDAVKLTAEAAPQHIKQNHEMSQVEDHGNDAISEDSKTRDDRSQDSDIENEQVLTSGRGRDASDGVGTARDIALRFSSKVHSLCLGFVFGRNPKSCDLLLCDNDNKQVSNKHFRIYINSHGVLMLEDTSTNGTMVDGTLLQGAKAKATDRDPQPRRTLVDGGMIQLPTITRTNGESVRFHVKMPSRNNYLAKYQQNLATYLACIEQAERQAKATADSAVQGLPMVLPHTVKVMQQGFQPETTPNGSILAAATGQHHHGMHWNGGDKYNVISYIGKGAFAMVYKLSSKRDGEVFAVKEIDKTKIKDRADAIKARKELDVIKSLRHPNIVKYIDHLDSPGHLYIIMEFVAYGDLRAYTDAGSAMPEYVCVHLAGQIMSALNYLHQRQIVHRDIKPDNILLAANYPYIFKLSDFGLSKMVTSGDYLQTFCGTLLYCAPEIYPGYARVKMGLPVPIKRTRANDAPGYKTLRYEDSVDTWSFAAVLYHLLCGRAPFPGTQENAMLVTVMTTPIDWERLKQAGITFEGIDFVQKMLQIEPSQRASDEAILEHPWLLSASDGPDLGKEQPQGLDASQLSLGDDDDFEDDGLDYIDDTADTREAKRMRPWPQDDVPRDEWGGNGVVSHFDMTGLAPGMSQHPPPQRLFGEIGNSALRSSGVLGQTTHAALEVQGGGSYDPATFGITGGGSYDPATFGIHAGGGYDASSTSASFVDPGFGQTTRAEDVSYIDPNHVLAHPTNEGVTQHSIQYPTLPAGTGYVYGAPSLLGTEAMVRDMKMTSPESGASSPSEGSKAASPKTPHSRELSPTVPGSKRPSQSRHSAEDEAKAKRSKTSRTPSSPSTRRQSGEASTQFPPYTSQAGGQGRGRAVYNPHQTTQRRRSSNAEQSSGAEDEQDGQPRHESRKDNTTMPPTAKNSQDSVQDSNGGSKPASRPASRRQSASNTASKAPSTHPTQANKSIPPSISLTRPSSSGGAGPTIAIADSPNFKTPSMVFGNLVLVRGSIPSVHKIRIQARITTYGRAFECDFVHQNNKDDRVPKSAINILMWYPNIEKDVAAEKDWTTNPALRAIITTRTSHYIKVNGIRLMKGTDCWAYGELRSGDLVSVFELREGRKAVTKEDKEFLQYRCEFYVGLSRESRKDDDPFEVKEEKEKFLEYQAAKEAEGSEKVDLIPTPGNGKSLAAAKSS